MLLSFLLVFFFCMWIRLLWPYFPQICCGQRLVDICILSSCSDKFLSSTYSKCVSLMLIFEMSLYIYILSFWVIIFLIHLHVLIDTLENTDSFKLSTSKSKILPDLLLQQLLCLSKDIFFSLFCHLFFPICKTKYHHKKKERKSDCCSFKTTNY